MQLYNHRNETYLSFETRKGMCKFCTYSVNFFEIGHNANSLQRFDDIHEILHHILDILHGHASVEREGDLILEQVIGIRIVLDVEAESHV